MSNLTHKKYSFKNHKLSNDEASWLSELLRESWSDIDPRATKINLHNKISPNFDPAKLDIRLVSQNGLTLLGLWYIDNKNPLINQTSLVIEKIRELIRKKPNLDRIDSQTISSALEIPKRNVEIIFTFLFDLHFCNAASGSPLFSSIGFNKQATGYDMVLNYKNIEDTLEKYYNDFSPQTPSRPKHFKTLRKYKTTSLLNNQNVWEDISKDYGISKQTFKKKVNFITDKHQSKVILRDVEQAYSLYKNGYSKPSIIIAGGVVEELLGSYLLYKKYISSKKSFDELIKLCEKNNYLKIGVRRLTDSARYFRNLVHIELEVKSDTTPSQSMASGVLSSIFTLVNDF